LKIQVDPALLVPMYRKFGLSVIIAPPQLVAKRMLDRPGGRREEYDLFLRRTRILPKVESRLNNACSLARFR
jgi:hypothetical protein